MPIKENVSDSKFLNLLNVINASQVFWILSFSFLTAIAAQITIPVKPVPFTLQTMMVLFAGAFLGAKRGALSQIIYLFLGFTGLPVFAQIPDLSIGFARLFGPTGGYLLSFPIAAFVTGYLIEKYKSYTGIVLSMLIGNLLILLLGSLYLSMVYIHDIKEALISGAVVFLVWMLFKVFIAAGIYFGFLRNQVNHK
mgnify:CR=1 FL=1